MRRKFARDKPETAIRRPDADSEVDLSLLQENVLGLLTRHASNILKVAPGVIDREVELKEYGFDSVALTEFATMLNETYGLDLPPTLFFEYPTIESLAKHLVDIYPEPLAARFTPDAWRGAWGARRGAQGEGRMERGARRLGRGAGRRAREVGSIVQGAGSITRGAGRRARGAGRIARGAGRRARGAWSEALELGAGAGKTRASRDGNEPGSHRRRQR